LMSSRRWVVEYDPPLKRPRRTSPRWQPGDACAAQQAGQISPSLRQSKGTTCRVLRQRVHRSLGVGSRGRPPVNPVGTSCMPAHPSPSHWRRRAMASRRARGPTSQQQPQVCCRVPPRPAAASLRPPSMRRPCTAATRAAGGRLDLAPPELDRHGNTRNLHLKPAASRVKK
jgi:hypothetical protein